MRNVRGRAEVGCGATRCHSLRRLRVRAISGSVQAVTFETMNGAPVQMQPYVDEPGAPVITIPPGSCSRSAVCPESRYGRRTDAATGGEALNTMLETSWGADAAAAAQAIGVNPLEY